MAEGDKVRPCRFWGHENFLPDNVTNLVKSNSQWNSKEWELLRGRPSPITLTGTNTQGTNSQAANLRNDADGLLRIRDFKTLLL